MLGGGAFCLLVLCKLEVLAYLLAGSFLLGCRRREETIEQGCCRCYILARPDEERRRTRVVGDFLVDLDRVSASGFASGTAIVTP